MGNFIKTGVKAGVQLEEYKGNISLVSGFQDEAGKITLEWVRAEHWDKEAKKKVPNEKNTPLKIYLGSKERAVEVLSALVWELQGGKKPESAEPGDVPF
jgi:hypothetical protein